MTVWCVFMEASGGERTLVRIFRDVEDACLFAIWLTIKLGGTIAVLHLMWEVDESFEAAIR